MVNRRSIAQLSDVHTRPPSCCLQLYFAEDENQDHGDQNGDDDHDQWYSGEQLSQLDDFLTTNDLNNMDIAIEAELNENIS